jgi:hypothetical protein
MCTEYSIHITTLESRLTEINEEHETVKRHGKKHEDGHK